MNAKLKEEAESIIANWEKKQNETSAHELSDEII